MCVCVSSESIPEEERAQLLKKAAATIPPKRVSTPSNPYKSKSLPQQATKPLSRIRSQAKTRRSVLQGM